MWTCATWWRATPDGAMNRTMYSRLIRAELFESERWLDLPSDTHRLVYHALIHEVDDFGNTEGGARRLFRWMHRFAQVKTEEHAVKIMSDLADADLVRRYQIQGRDTEFWHLPRFQNARRYTTRKQPRSPWCDAGKLSTVEQFHNKNNTELKKPAADLPQTYGRPAADLPRGVGVGVGVGVNTTPEPIINPQSTADASDEKPALKKSFSKPPTQTRDQFIESEAKRLGVSVQHGETWTDFAARVEKCRSAS